jgi:Kef-type K+ transport system membrane component KefB
MEEIGYLMLQIFLLLLLAEVLGQVLKKINMPEMVGYILGGILFVNLTVFLPGFGYSIHFNISEIESDSNHFLNVMGHIGLVFLMFGIGLKTRLSDLVDVGKPAIVISLVSIAVPFLGGYAVYYLFGSDTNVAIMVGTALFASSTTITVNMLNYFGISETKEGKLIVGVSIIVDIICLVILAVNTSIVSPVHEHSWWMNILVSLIFVALVFLFIAHTKHRSEKRKDLMDRLDLELEDIRKGLFVVAIITCFGLTALSYLVGLSVLSVRSLQGCISRNSRPPVTFTRNSIR